MRLYPEFQKEGVEILGFNHNPMKSHEKWQDKLGIPFPLLSDEGLEVLKSFGVWQKKK
jgi:thioredoxin-dependent peroxiredoxin